MANSRSWKIATIRGVELKLHFSLLILLVYVVMVASMQYPLVAKQAGLDPASLRGGPLIWGFIFAIALLVSVAIHEFGHVLVAQAHGVRVRGITLMMLGGMSEMEEMPEKPYAEFKLSIIGPIVSFAIAGLLFFLRSLTSSGELVLFTSWLGTVNLVLAIFNLVPAFPLDGGRALRSVLSARQGKLRGTQVAVAISKSLAWALGILGLMGMNFLLILIAFFVYTAANSELFLLTSRTLLKDVKAGEIGIRTRVLEQAEFMDSTAEEMITLRTSILPVRIMAPPGAAIVRLASFRRIPRDHWRHTRIESVMEPVAKVLDVNEPLSDNLPVLASNPGGALPLKTEDGRIVGIVRSADVFELMQFRSLRPESSASARDRDDHKRAA
ncbi:MAG: hypothetical protein A2X94_12305 [Bdellovibrionales bacterium GWB1_55_8]|nr:MAG: hypothetical protein A2X94_12305 [Bdellovibrionales bacterium GWB1_55_8]